MKQHAIFSPAFRHALTVMLSLACLAPIANAEFPETETHGDIVLFPGPFEPLASSNAANDGAPNENAKVGWNIPGVHYRAGSGWWALICDAGNAQPGEKQSGCRLAATNLSIVKGKHPVYDGEPVTSQLLHWSPLPGQLNIVGKEEDKHLRLLMVFKPTRSLAGLKLSEGPVVTYLHRGMNEYPKPPGPGTLEVRIPVGPGAYADIVPRVFKSSSASAAESVLDSQGGIGAHVDVLELRVGAKRQRLSGQWAGCSAEAIRHPKDYLWWAGDLDGDGKLDFILSRDDSNHVILYLSSAAKDDELVGEAGSFNFSDPAMGEC